MAALKEIYSKKFIQDFSNSFEQIYPALNKVYFVREILAKPWNELELKQRITRIADVMIAHLPMALSSKLKIIKKLIDVLREKGVSDFNFPYIFLPEIIQRSGIANFKVSMEALELITVFTSAEFAIRYFYVSDYEHTVEQMKKWSKHRNPMVRRLSSEGSRPLLPWGIGIPKIKADPKEHLIILENLWDDENEIVRRSVSNHLNDISKLNPNLAWNFSKNKLGKSKETDKDLKHGLRTLLKKGNQEILKAFSYHTDWKPRTAIIILENDKVVIGDRLHFKIQIRNNSKFARVRLEYKISFLMSNGTWNKKVFQLDEVGLKQDEIFEKKKSHSFIPITTRTYYSGKHFICLVINGIEYDSKEFNLVALS